MTSIQIGNVYKNKEGIEWAQERGKNILKV